MWAHLAKYVLDKYNWLNEEQLNIIHVLLYY